jgi:colicin import membrane protein
MPKTSFAIFMSLFSHVALGALLLISVDFSSLKPPEDIQTPQVIIEAKVVDEKTVNQQIKKIRDKKEAIRKKEEKRVRDIQEREQKRLLRKKKAEQAAIATREKKKKDQEKAKELERERIEQEKKRKEKEAKDKREKEQRDKEEKALKEAERKRQEAQEKAAQEKLLEEQLQAEQLTRQKKRNKQVLSEVQKYQALIRQTIQRNLIVDDSMKGKSCRLNIRLASNGLVTQVKELSGDTILCRAAKSAVLKSDTLPVSKEADVYEELREINLTVEPEL